MIDMLTFAVVTVALGVPFRSLVMGPDRKRLSANAFPQISNGQILPREGPRVPSPRRAGNGTFPEKILDGDERRVVRPGSQL